FSRDWSSDVCSSDLYLKEHLSQRLPKNIKLDVLAQEISDLPEGVTFTGERAKPWGTAHAVWTARNVIKNSFAIINADDYYGKNEIGRASCRERVEDT